MNVQPSSLLRFLSILLNNKNAPSILQSLRDAQKCNSPGERSDRIRKAVGISETKKGLFSETLSKLEAANLIFRERRNGALTFSITADGLKALGEYERLANDREFDSYPDTVKEILRRHGHIFLLPAQKEFVKKVYPPKRNLIVVASPSAGKTLIAEFCIFNELEKDQRVLYITPYKALNRQKFNLFKQIFSEQEVVRTDGDTFVPTGALTRAKLIVATYERALAGMLQNEEWLQNLSLVVADEITLLKDLERGSNLDLLISLLKAEHGILTLSSHIGNTKVIKAWLDADSFEWPPDDIPQEFIATKKGSRVQIQDTIGSQKHKYNDSSVFQAILEHSQLKDDDTMIVLVGTRLKAQDVARKIGQLLPEKPRLVDTYTASSIEEDSPLLKKLSKSLKHGVAFHHAGLPYEVRESVESLLDKRQIAIVVSTPTLSHGVDFPLDHVIVDFDSFLFGQHGLGKIEYIQYRGRAARIGKSRGGNVYVCSEAGATEETLREFLSKPVEEIYPPCLNPEYIEWLVLLACKQSANKKIIANEFKHVASSLLSVRNPEYKITPAEFGSLTYCALKNLRRRGFVSENENEVVLTEVGKLVSKIDLLPSDAHKIVQTLGRLKDEQKSPMIMTHLLNIVSCVGLVKSFDRTRVDNIMWTYLESMLQTNRLLTRRGDFRAVSLSSVLLRWTEEEKIKDIIKNCTRGEIVQDEDIRKLAGYAGIEMKKIAFLAGGLGYETIAKIAERLSVRLKYGVKDDLIGDNPTIRLFRLGGIGRVRARRLYKLGFRNLLDIYTLVFNEGERAFLKISALTDNIAESVLRELRSLVQSDKELESFCKRI